MRARDPQKNFTKSTYCNPLYETKSLILFIHYTHYGITLIFQKKKKKTRFVGKKSSIYRFLAPAPPPTLDPRSVTLVKCAKPGRIQRPGFTSHPCLKRLAHRPISPVGSLYKFDSLLDVDGVAEFDQ